MMQTIENKPIASLYGEAIKAQDGNITVPTGPGLGLEPNPDVIKDYCDKET